MYKGYRLELEYQNDNDHPASFHRNCNVYLNDKCIMIAKNKKQAKKQIDEGVADLTLKIMK